MWDLTRWHVYINSKLYIHIMKYVYSVLFRKVMFKDPTDSPCLFTPVKIIREKTCNDKILKLHEFSKQKFDFFLYFPVLV